MTPEQLAINSVSTRTADLETCLAAYAEAGFVNVEFVLSHVKKYLEGGHSLADLGRLLKKHELKCIGGFESGVLCFAGADEQRQNHAKIVENAQLLADLGGTNLVVGTDGPAEAAAHADLAGEMAEVFAALGRRIEATGVGLCIEFNWSPVAKSLRTAVEIARRSGAKNVGVLFDPAHFHCTPTKFDQLSAGNVQFIRHVHVDDMRDKPAEFSNCNSDRVLPGDGCLDLRALFQQLETHGYRGYYSIEMFSEELWRLPAREAAQRMYASLLPLCERPGRPAQ